MSALVSFFAAQLALDQLRRTTKLKRSRRRKSSDSHLPTLPAGKGCHAAAPGLTGRATRIALRDGALRAKSRRSSSPTVRPPCASRFDAESKGAKIETVTKEKGDDDQSVFWAEVKLDGRPYAIGVLEDGTLSEIEPGRG